MGKSIDNKGFNEARKNKNDEFYTQLRDIDAELKWYRKHFQNKTVLLNCDDPEWSNFYFHFKELFNDPYNLKKLIATHYELSGKQSYKLEVTRDKNNELVYTKTPLEGNGDFRSEECVELLKEADIIVTNPPFSLFKEYISQLLEYNKKFLIIGNVNALTYKEVFENIKNNKMWMGVSITSGDREFRVPDHYPLLSTGNRIDQNGNKYIRVKGVRWFTNLDHNKRYDDLFLYKRYENNENKYPKYENYEAINVDKTSDIPEDYEGVMGVPITFLDKYNPQQFEIIGLTASWDNSFDHLNLRTNPKKRNRGIIEGKDKYARVLIKNKKPNNTKL